MLTYLAICLIARKKLLVSLSYFIGSFVVFFLSIKTADQWHQISSTPRSYLPIFIVNQELNASAHDDVSVYRKRAKLLEDECNRHHYHSSNVEFIIRRHDILDYLSFVIRSRSLLYCSVPKVATRSFLPFITYLHLHEELAANAADKERILKIGNDSIGFNITYLSELLSSTVANQSEPPNYDWYTTLSTFESYLVNDSGQLPWDLWKIHQDKVFPLIRPRSLPDSSVMFSDGFTRAIFVRHPLERLASAYVDKIMSLQAPTFTLYDNLRRAICRKFASFYLKPNEVSYYFRRMMVSKPTYEPCEKVIPSFQHFLEYLVRDSLLADVHWQPYTSLCQACAFKYNFIGKYETLNNDLNNFLLRINVTSSNWNFNRRYTTGRTREQYKLMYSKLPESLLCRLKQIYRKDLKLFDYTFEDYLDDRRSLTCT